MSRISSLYLADILESCEKIRKYVNGVTFDEFVADEMRVDAVVRNLEIIGEAVKNLPDDVKEREPAIERKKIARLRDVIAHHYFKVDYDRVWSISQEKLSDLESVSRKLFADLSSDKETDRN